MVFETLETPLVDCWLPLETHEAKLNLYSLNLALSLNLIHPIHPTPHILHPTPETLNPTLQPVSYTLRPSATPEPLNP